MSDDIKVGDVCTVIAIPGGLAQLVGTEVEVIGAERLHRVESAVAIFECFGFLVRSVLTGKLYAIHRICVKKKRPPPKDDAEPRLDLVPAIADDWTSTGWHPKKARETESA